jgi:chromosome segregation ATPase
MSRRHGQVKISLREKVANMDGGDASNWGVGDAGTAIDAKIVRVPSSRTSLSRGRATLTDRTKFSSPNQSGDYLTEELARTTLELARVKREKMESDAEYEDEIRRVVGQLTVAKEQLEKLEDLSNTVQAVDLVAENTQLRTKLANEEADIEGISREIELLNIDHQKLMQKNKQLEEENNALRVDLGNASNTDALVLASDTAVNENEAAENPPSDQLTHQLQQAGDALERLIDEKEDLMIKCKQLELEINRLEDALDHGGQISVDNSGVEFKVEQLQQALEKAEVGKEKAQDEKEDLQIRNTELLIEIETLEEEILRLDEHLKHSD